MRNQYLLCLGASGTPFLDAFFTVSGGFLLLSLAPQFNLSTWSAGAYGTSYLFGVMAGSFLVSTVNKKLKTENIYFLSPLAIFILLLSQVLFDSFFYLLAARFLFGFFIGSDYPISQVFFSSQCHTSFKAKGLTLLMSSWYWGAIFAILVFWFASLFSVSSEILLVAPALIPLVVLLTRLPYFSSTSKTSQKSSKNVSSSPISKSWSKESLLNLGFLCAFWTCQCIPVTVILLFGPSIMEALGFSGSGSFFQLSVTYIFFFIGSSCSYLIIDKCTRKFLALITFALMTLCLIPLLWADSLSLLIIVFAFIGYAASYGLQTTLDYVYPNEIFEVKIREQAIGVLTCVTRFVSGLSAFFFPYFLSKFSITSIILAAVFILTIGFFSTYLFAPVDACSKND